MAQSFSFPLTSNDALIASAIEHLDQVAIGYEAKWGVGRLPQIVNDDLKKKWHRQMEKLAEAMKTGHVENVRTLTHGMVRGWERLEQEAIAAGHVPLPSNNWEYVHPATGRKFNLCRNTLDASSTLEGFETITIAELINVYVANHKLATLETSKPVTWIDEALSGDEIPW